MAVKDFIVAIELGSSKVTGMAGKKNVDGSIQVLAVAQEESSSFIRKGMVYNIDKTAQCITNIVGKLQQSLKMAVGKVYVGVSGQSLHTVKNIVVRQLETETIISQELIDSINDTNQKTAYPDHEILGVVPQEYKVGSEMQTEPVGILSDRVEGRFLNIIARTTVRGNIEKCFQLAGIEIAELVISPLALADSVLTETEKRSGCALIDFGADTTTVSVYKNNLLRHLAVIPLGGSNITKDICSLQIEEDEAEKLKLEHGSAYSEPAEDEEAEVYPLSNDRTVDSKVLMDVVEARTEEIISNVWNQIRLSGCDDKLLAGIIITGGAANISDLEVAFTQRTLFDKLRMAKTIQMPLQGTQPEVTAKDGRLNTAVGLLATGRRNCCAGELSTRTIFDESGTDAIARRRQQVEEIAEREAREKREAEARRIAEEAEKRREEEARIKAEEEAERKRKKKENSIFTKLGKKFSQFSKNLIEEE